MTTLYGAILSPFVRKVLMFLEIKGIPYELQNVAPGAMPEGYETIHPLKRIPALKDDWVTLADSSVICDYLEHRYPAPALYPKEIVQRAKALWLEEYADTKLVEVLGRPVFYKRIITKGMLGQSIDEQEIAAHIEKFVPPVFDYLETQVPEQGYLIGTALSIADISVTSHLINAAYANLPVDAGRWPKLAAYYQRMTQTPAFQARLAHDEKLLSRLLKKV
ncbi:MAG TPA: glutathione S-transferase family protein [Pseudomonadales bacterium]|nr:glutathione S-transferase family protein [Pseudomonadales bacterium]